MAKYLWLMSCAHIGALAHDHVRFKKYLGWAKASGADIAIMGDLLDTGTCFGTKHIGSVWDNDLDPQGQIDRAVELLAPLRKKIVAVVTGNHEARIEAISSINPLKQVADRLDIKYQNSRTVFRWEGLNIFATHGTSAGYLTDFTKVMNAYEGLDVVAIGHTHQLYTQDLRRFAVDRGGRVSEREIKLVRCGNFLTDAEYAKRAGHPPTKTGSPILVSSKDGLYVKLGL